MTMLNKLGRVLQLAGLLIVPLAMAGNLTNPGVVGIWPMLAIAAAGVGVFFLGWLLQQMGRSK